MNSHYCELMLNDILSREQNEEPRLGSHTAMWLVISLNLWFDSVLFNNNIGAERTAQWLRVLSALPSDPI